MAENRYLAADLGAESGRVVLGTLSDGKLSLEEIHRFPNEPVTVRGTLHWDVLSLYNNVLKGMREYAGRYGEGVSGVGIDTWAVDFGLLASDGSLLQNPVCYRDARTEGMPRVVTDRIPEPELYRRTGIYMLPIYTLCQLVSLRENDSPLLECADRLLMMPDLLGYFLCGATGCERTNAITTELYDPRARRWREDVFDAFDLPLHIMPDLVEPGTVLGQLDPKVCEETGLAAAPVIAPCTHDTGSAVAAVPGEGEDWAFLSSGTWSILGSLTDQVYTSKEALEAGLCNEMTVDGLFLCRNIMGLWLLQQARAAWEREGRSYSYPELVGLGEDAPPGGPLVDPNKEVFTAPDDMVEEIGSFCRATGQEPPEEPPEVVRCILESLALSYARTLGRLSGILDRRFGAVYVVGGGSQNTLLNQFTADATGLPVHAGPVEATVAGNLLVQALATGNVGSPEEIRRIVRESFPMEQFRPEESAYWEDRRTDYEEVLAKSN